MKISHKIIKINNKIIKINNKMIKINNKMMRKNYKKHAILLLDQHLPKNRQNKCLIKI